MNASLWYHGKALARGGLHHKQSPDFSTKLPGAGHCRKRLEQLVRRTPICEWICVNWMDAVKVREKEGGGGEKRGSCSG